LLAGDVWHLEIPIFAEMSAGDVASHPINPDNPPMNPLTKCSTYIISIVFWMLGAGSFSSPALADAPHTLQAPYRIGISQIVEHPALDAVRLGMLAALKEAGYGAGENLNVHYENAQGNMATATQIATQLVSEPLDVLVGISTPAAQTLLYAAKKNQKEIPIVFAAVSDPLSAKLEPRESHYPMTGITDVPNLEVLRDLMHGMVPHLKTVGFIYNASEANSVATLERFQKLWQVLNIKVVTVTVNKTSEVAQGMQSLIGKVDAVYFPQDNTVVSAIKTVVNIAAANEAGQHGKALPLFCSDPLLVAEGVLGAVGYDYTEVGKETGLVVARLLKGEAIETIPIHSPLKLKTVVNRSVAKHFGLPEMVDIEYIDTVRSRS